MTKPTNPHAEIYAGFLRNTENHVLYVLSDNGLYRHLRFQEPGTRMWSMDIVTWPGHLATSGDIGEGLVFSREEDMIPFFYDAGRGPDGYYSDGAPSIDFHYWAEKIQGRGLVDVKKYDPDLFLQLVREHLEESEELGTEAQEEYNNIVEATRQVCAFHGIDFNEYLTELHQRGDSRYALLEIDADNDENDLQHLYYGLEIPSQSPEQRRAEILEDAKWHSDSDHDAHEWLRDHEDLVGSDTWEWDLSGFDTHFLFACYCIDAAVRLYREYVNRIDAQRRR